MSTALLERLRASREVWVEAGGFRFLIRRPTDVQLIQWREIAASDEPEPSRVLRRCLIGWEGVREIDLVPGGSAESAPFDVSVAVEWLEDSVELYSQVIDGIRGTITAHADALRADEKN